MKKQPITGAFRRILNSSNLKMKFTLLFLFTSLLQVYATSSYGQNNKVTMDVNGLALTNVFKIIEDQTDFHFFYNRNELNVNQKIDLNVQKKQVVEVLGKLFNNTNISYQILGNQIVLKKVEKQKGESISSVMDQKQIEGVVTDAVGIPLVGVTVLIEGTRTATSTDFDGRFKLSANASGSFLVFSHLGYQSKRVPLGGSSLLKVVLEEEFNELQEVVLVGYGKQKRTEFSGAVSSIDAKDIVQAATGSIGFDRALGGLVKGVQVSQNTGRPGAPVRINIRGITSPLSSAGGGLNQPLFVIDGVPFNLDALQGANPLSTLNPNDIESFDVLKDAGATAIYGSRGANGVIIIKTKRGKKGQSPRVNFSYATTLAQPINKLGVLNSTQYKNYYNLLMSNSVDAMNNGQLDPFLSFDLANIAKVDLDWDTFMVNYDGMREDYFGTANTDWNKEVYRSMAVTKQANLSLSGGSDKTNYNFSSSFIDQEGLTVNDKMKQYNLGISLDTDLTDYIKMGSSVNIGHTEANSGENDVLNQYTINTSIARARPDLPVRDENGKLLGQPDYQYGFMTLEPNPLMRLSNKTNNKAYNFIGSAYVEVEPLKDLKIKTDVNASVFYNKNRSFIPKIVETDFVFFPNDSYLNEADGLVSNITTNLTANYDFAISNHKIGLLAGAAWDKTAFNSSNHFYSGFPDDEILINATSARTVIGYSSNRSETALYSLFSRLNYGYKNLYNATLNFRTDTSSKFGPDNKRAYFPSLSASWNISNEKFLADSEKINILKLRASVGRVGSTNVSDFAFLQFLQTSSSNVYNGNSGIVLDNNFPNPNIGWETTNEVNLGLDFGFFNNRLKGGIDVYDRKTTGALVGRPIPYELGPSTYYSNFMDVSNKGIEISLGGDIIRGEDFVWSTNVNWSLNRNKLVKLKGANINPYQLDYYIEGQPVGTIMGYKVAKIFQSQDEVDALNAASPSGVYDKMSTTVGDFMMEDVNGDGQVTADDRTVIGSIQPDFFGGISNTFAYKNFSLSALFQYSVGTKSIWNAIPMSTFNPLGENKYSEYALNTWTPENPNARYAKAVYTDPSSNGRISDRYIYDTSYLRLKNVQLSYNLDTKVLDKIGLDRATFTLTATNLLTWTKWPGMDPETFSERGTITDQISNEDPYPLAKSFSLGIQVQF
ncbi:TonB-dependent receptor [Flavobacterium granuli]|uniref:TonB-linked SusC/RagA family outer membrane protein n=1 Tax=Flavobacterium granuli TaxID=280093 RepID=A0A1M5IXT4_9FLAO|nr:TonB-dependent receptor [Flavobacterium granuli]PRZ28155.1 TonB-linked SusC/RagA family outer membrane protein [Flavobacterium granuli]SHG33178.1 TonB-linked outer membrane protein, SusC/RagA family [Flavobacterium granuli]